MLSNSSETTSFTMCSRVGSYGKTESTLRSTTSETDWSIVRKFWFCEP